MQIQIQLNDYKRDVANGKFTGTEKAWLEQKLEISSGGSIGTYDDTEIKNELANIKNSIRTNPTYKKPTMTISASPTFIENGVNTGVTVSTTYTQNDGGNRVKTTISDGSNSVERTSTIFYISSEKTYAATIQYAEGSIKNDNLGQPYPTGRIEAGTINASVKVNAYDPIFRGIGTFSMSNLGTKDVTIKPSNKTYSFSTINESCFIASPYKIKKIEDSNGFDNTESFSYSKTTYTRTNGTNVIYHVYKSKIANLSDFSYKFTFE